MAARKCNANSSLADDLDDYEFDTVVRKLERNKNPFYDDSDETNFDAPLSKQELIQNRILGSTNRSLGLVEESHNIAIKTAEELQRQEESLYRTERNLDDMQRNMASANRHIKSVKSVWGAIGNYFSKPKDTLSVRKETERLQHSAPERSLNIDANVKFDYGQGNSYSDFETVRSKSAFEREHEKQLGEISRGLRILKDDALVLGETIDRQDEIITRVQGKVDIVHDDIQGADRKIRRILRK